MIRSWILNASPLILLGKAELLRDIAPLADTWIIPGGVAKEVAVKSPINSYIGDLSVGSQVLQIDVALIAPSVAGWDLGRGESEVISLALEKPHTGVVVDDSQARKCARILDIALVGSLGLILKAKRENLIPLARPLIDRLVSVGLYVDPETRSRVLAAIGEQPAH